MELVGRGLVRDADNGGMMKVYDFNPYMLPGDLLQAIGLALSSAAQTEDIVNRAIAGLAGVDFEIGGAVTAHVAMSIKFSMLSSLGELRFSNPDELAKFDKHVERIKNAFDKRNGLAHDRWARDPEDDSVGQIQEVARTHYEMTMVPTTVEDVEEMAKELYVSGMEFFVLLKHHGLDAKIPDSPRVRAHKSHGDRKAYKRASRC